MATTSVVEIYLDAVAANYRLLKARAAKDCAAVVKADAYGLGAVRVAQKLWQEGCRYFFVATIDEGVELRKAGVQGFIGVFYGIASREDAELARAHQLTPSLNTCEQVKRFNAFAREVGAHLPAMLHVDSGMTRLGVSHAEAQAIAQGAQSDALRIDWVMSHLACASEPQHPQNAQQRERFVETAKLFPHAKLSFANSSGIFLGEEYHFDLCRPGAALYGISPVPQGNPMQQVVTVKCPVIQVRKLEQAEHVGYGATYFAPKHSVLLTVAGGYADGFIRSLSNRGYVVVNGHKAPIAGIVSMDVVVVDVTHVPGEFAEGGWVEVVGKHHPVDAVAAQAGTIGYEILTGMNKRVKRVYLGD